MSGAIRLSAHLSMLFAELPYLERPAAAAAAGFDLVETWWPGEEIEPWVAEVRRLGLGVVNVNADCGDIAAGDRGFLNVPAERQRSLDAVARAAAAASRCGAPFVNVLVGRDTGGAPLKEQLRVAADALVECAAIARTAGVRILVEPVNDGDVPGYLVPTPAEAAALVEAAGSGDVRLLYDVYHAARMGLDPVADVAQWLRLVGHVHYADCPGRGAPGTGTIDLGQLLETLEEGGYEGAVGLELDPRGPTRTALAGLTAARARPGGAPPG